ncbi:MAG: glycoside hydrolase family 9 protein [Lachnospiraceae bacterium]|nr:glycoside hydrolase family 9 protein [Lachnospiraceae bacterium]
MRQMGKVGRGKCISAWMLTLVMVLSLVMVPAGQVEAEGGRITVTGADDTSKPVHVKVVKEKSIPVGSWEGGGPSEELTQYTVEIVNGTSGTISDWELTITCNTLNTYNAGWNGAPKSITGGNNIVVGTYTGDGNNGTWTNATIAAGKSATGAGFQMAARELENATYTLTYKQGESSGSSSSGGGTFEGGNIGTIDTSQDYNFAKLLQYSLYFYDANMCGDQVSETSLYSKDLYNGWRGDCHVNDSFTYNGKTYSAVGGYHDAGDHVKFGLPMSEAMTALGIGYYEFGAAFDELGQKQHLKTIVDYYCTYVKNCTVLNAAGTEAEAFCYQVGCGQKDHESWCAPEVENEVNTQRSYTLVATPSNPATDIVGGTAAALTLNYLNFGDKEDLKYAKALFAFAKKNQKKRGASDTSGSFYYSDYGSWEDEYCLAAALLYKATNDADYKKEYNANNRNTGNIEKPFGWENVYQAASFYAPDKNSTELSTINNWFAGVANANKSQYYCGDSWGSARINCNVQLMMLVYDKQNGTNTYSEWCKHQMSIILGNNSQGRNLVCGYNTNSPTKPHHRAASGYSGWDEFNSNAAQKYTLFGALAGGPTSSDFSTYNDKVNDAVSNEVTLDYNAGMVGAAAALYLLYKDSKEEGFTNQTIRADFYGGSEFVGVSGEVDKDLTGSNGEVKATGLTLNANVKNASGVPVKATYKLAAKKSMQLKVSFLPENAQKEKLTYTSSNPKIAKVSASGKVTAKKKAGTTTITVTSANGLKKSFKVKVIKKAVKKVTIKVKKAVSLKKGKTLQLKASVSPKGTSKTVFWKSSKKKIATVSQSGKVKALKKGTVKITAVATDGSGKKATLKIKIK